MPPQILSTGEFESSIHQLAPRVAVFDCDGTLWSGDAGSGFMLWTIETGFISRDAIDWIEERYRGYKRGEVSELAICGEMVQVYRGIPETVMRDAAREFFRAFIAPNIFPELQRVIAGLQQQDVDIRAVSSTCDWVIEEGVRYFDLPADCVLAARVESSGGIVTDRLIDVPTDQGKVDSLGRVGITHPDAVFGNSVHDAAMLAIARRAFPVNPTAALIERSAEEGWPIYFPDSVRPLSL